MSIGSGIGISPPRKSISKMAAPGTGPIVSPTHYDPSFKVDIQLHQPLLSRGTTPADVRLDMMSLCFQLETLCKKELNEQSSIHNGHVSNSFIDRATIVYDRMEHLMAKVPPEQSDCIRYLQYQGLDQLFPRAMLYLANPNTFSMDLDKTPLDNYYTSLCNLSQLSTLARQLHNDCISPSSHKYIAHQLAILYQTITSMKSPAFAQHKQSIEGMFKPIKATLAGSSDERQRCLSNEQQEWLLNITGNIINTVALLPSELTQDMLQLATILQCTM